MDLISDIRIWPTKNNSSVKANGSMVVAGAFVVKFALMEGKEGLFVSLPSEKYVKDGETKYTDKVWILKNEVRADVNKLVIAAYNNKIQASTEDQGSHTPADQTVVEESKNLTW